VFQTKQPLRRKPSLRPSFILAIDSGGTRVAPDRPEGRLQIARVEHLVPEPKPFGRRLALFEPG